MIEIIGLFKSADVIITANPAVSGTLVEVKARNLFWGLPREGSGSPLSLREIIASGCHGRCTKRAVEVPLHQEMAGAEKSQCPRVFFQGKSKI